MEVINFRDTRQTMHDGDIIKEVYLGSELMWKMTTRLTGVYSRDEVDLEGLERHGVNFDISSVYFDGFMYISMGGIDPKYIEINGQFVEVLDGEFIGYLRTYSFQTNRFNKIQAEQLLGITIDDPDQMGMPIPESVEIYAWA